jgi:hypothetical protein
VLLALAPELYIRRRFMFKPRRSKGGDLDMRHSLARSVVGLLALLSFASVALAEGSKLPSRDDL